MRSIPVFLAVLLMVFTVAVGTEIPVSVFVVHCEPTNADPAMWAALVDLVALAEQHGVPLTIDFTAQWAAMILEDEVKVDALETWLDNGHEIACHHHPYWTAMTRSAQWDGYTNTPFDEILPQDRPCFRGTMADYLDLLDALPGERRSGCLGGSDERDEADWPCSLLYSTRGHAVEDAVSTPLECAFGGCTVWEIGHTLILSGKPGELRAAFETADAASVFGVVGHVYNYADLPMAFEAWFSYLASVDPDGTHRGTVSSVIDDWLAARP